MPVTASILAVRASICSARAICRPLAMPRPQTTSINIKRRRASCIEATSCSSASLMPLILAAITATSTSTGSKISPLRSHHSTTCHDTSPRPTSP